MDPRRNGNHQQLPSHMTERQHQRFSWQMPPTEDAPAYEQVQQHQHQHPHYQQAPQPAQQQQHVSTNEEPQNRHFSYAQTPVEHEAFFYVSSPSDPPVPQAPQGHGQHMQSPCTPIDPRPQSTFHPLTSVAQSPHQHQGYAPSSTHPHDEKPPVSPLSPRDPSRPIPFSPVSPPQAYEYAHPTQPPQVIVPHQNHARKLSNLSPINTNLNHRPMPTIPPTPPSGHPTSPLPQKTPITPMSPGGTTRAINGDNRTSYATEPYSPHGFDSNQTNNLHAVFSPDAAHGPNGLDFSKHQPGQITHPNMDSASPKQWSSSLCACSPDPSTCLTGLLCPCIIYGRTSHRLSQKSAKKDPTDMLGHSATNGHCTVMALSCGLWWLFPMLQRTRIRHMYKLPGSCGGDFVKSCCCCCCVAVLNEREVRGREEASRRWAGPASADVYMREGGMVYKPQW